LQRLVVNSDDDDARVHRALAPQGKAHIQGALFYVLEKEKAGTLVAADSSESKKHQSKDGDGYSNRCVPAERKLKRWPPEFTLALQGEIVTTCTSIKPLTLQPG
jgi:hypothetical protein